MASIGAARLPEFQAEAHEGRVSEDDDNLSWYLAEIEKARSRDRLDWIAEIVKYCKWENEAWTKDEDGMDKLRSAWAKRAGQIAGEPN